MSDASGYDWSENGYGSAADGYAGAADGYAVPEATAGRCYAGDRADSPGSVGYLGPGSYTGPGLAPSPGWPIPGIRLADPMLAAPDAGADPYRWQADQDLRREAGRRGLVVGAVTGFLAAAVAIGVSTLAAGFVRPQASPMAALGSVFIDRTPAALKNVAVQHFGTNGRTVLLLGMYAAIAVLAVGIGVLARRAAAPGVAGLAAFSLLAAFVTITRPGGRVSDVAPAVIGGIAGVAALLWLMHASAPPIAPATVRARRRPQEATMTTTVDRRKFLTAAGVTAVRRPRRGWAANSCSASTSARPRRRRVSPPRLPRPRSPSSQIATDDAAAGRRDAEHRGPVSVLHAGRGFLPGGHGPGPAAGRGGHLAAAHPRHGRQPGDRSRSTSSSSGPWSSTTSP